MRLSTYFVAPGNKFLLTERKEKDKKIIFMHLKENLSLQEIVYLITIIM